MHNAYLYTHACTLYKDKLTIKQRQKTDKETNKQAET